jgi:hypothetical protein
MREAVGAGLEELPGCVPGEEVLKDEAVIDVGQAAQVAGFTASTCQMWSSCVKPSASTAAPAITSLMQEYGARWAISCGADLAVWSAERRDTSGLRSICDRDPAALAAKLAVAEAGQ